MYLFLTSSSSFNNLNATITSASTYFEDTTIPGGECAPIPLAGVFKPNSTTSVVYALNYYKYGAMSLSTNPYQNSTNISQTSEPMANLSIGQTTFSITMNASYQPNYTLSNTNIVPGSVVIPFSVNYQATNSTTFSSTTITSSVTYTTNTYNSTNVGSYTATGVCIDNSNSSFTYTSSLSGMSCAGTINYNSGSITNFKIIAQNPTQFSYTLTSSITNNSGNNSSTTITNEYIYNSLSLPNPSVTAIYYQYSTGGQPTNSSVVQAYIPSSTTTYTYPLYQVISYIPLYISYTPLGSSSPITFYCSQNPCNVSGNIVSATLPYTSSPSTTVMLNYQEKHFKLLIPM